MMTSDECKERLETAARAVTDMLDDLGNASPDGQDARMDIFRAAYRSLSEDDKARITTLFRRGSLAVLSDALIGNKAIAQAAFRDLAGIARRIDQSPDKEHAVDELLDAANELGADDQKELLKVLEFIGILRVMKNDPEEASADPEPHSKTVLRRLFAENPSPLPNQAPALECAVMFAGGGTSEGALSETPDGGLRMLTPMTPQAPGLRPGKVMMIEKFFAYEDIVAVAVRREVTIEAPTRIVSH